MTRSRLFMTLALVTSSACGAIWVPTSGDGGGSGGSGGAPTGGASGLGGAGPTGGASGLGGATGGMPGTGGAAGTGGGQTGGHLGAGGVAGGHAGTMGAGGAAGGHAGATATAGNSGGGGNSGAGGLGPEAPGGRVSGFGTVLISASSTNQITRLQTEMVVPPEPPASGTLFLWPGLQPGGANFDPINNGVLQPVLTLGLVLRAGQTAARLFDLVDLGPVRQHLRQGGRLHRLPGRGCHVRQRRRQADDGYGALRDDLDSDGVGRRDGRSLSATAST